jgi:hypothetical protein
MRFGVFTIFKLLLNLLKLHQLSILSFSRCSQKNYPMSLKRIFSHIYQVNLWQSAESTSGRGSEAACTIKIQESLVSILQEFNIKSIVDAPCGDFNWMSRVPLSSIDYQGLDIVPEVIEKARTKYNKVGLSFTVADITKTPLPTVDLIICRDGLVHLSFKDIFSALKNFKNSHSTYLLTTTYPNLSVNRNIPSGSWRPLNFEKPPFNFSPPILIFRDPSDDTGCNPDKSLALWLLKDIDLNSPSFFNPSSVQISLISFIRRFIPSFLL